MEAQPRTAVSTPENEPLFKKLEGALFMPKPSNLRHEKRQGAISTRARVKRRILQPKKSQSFLGQVVENLITNVR